jgi:hypothetical protein
LPSMRKIQHFLEKAHGFESIRFIIKLRSRKHRDQIERDAPSEQRCGSSIPFDGS